MATSCQLKRVFVALCLCERPDPLTIFRRAPARLRRVPAVYDAAKKLPIFSRARLVGSPQVHSYLFRGGGYADPESTGNNCCAAKSGGQSFRLELTTAANWAVTFAQFQFSAHAC